MTSKLSILELENVPYPDKETLVHIFELFTLLSDVKIGFGDSWIGRMDDF
jgi:hypothetical protein